MESGDSEPFAERMLFVFKIKVFQIFAQPVNIAAYSEGIQSWIMEEVLESSFTGDIIIEGIYFGLLLVVKEIARWFSWWIKY